MLERAKRMLPHVAILVCNMYIAFYLIDRVNTAMNFIDNGLTKGLLLILCAVGAVNAWTLIHAPAPRPARPAQPRRVPERAPAQARTRYAGDDRYRQAARPRRDRDARYDDPARYGTDSRYDDDARYGGNSRYEDDARYGGGRAREADRYGDGRYGRDGASSRRRHYDTEPRRRSEGYIARSGARDDHYLDEAYGDDGYYR